MIRIIQLLEDVVEKHLTRSLTEAKKPEIEVGDDEEKQKVLRRKGPTATQKKVIRTQKVDLPGKAVERDVVVKKGKQGINALAKGTRKGDKNSSEKVLSDKRAEERKAKEATAKAARKKAQKDLSPSKRSERAAELQAYRGTMKAAKKEFGEYEAKGKEGRKTKSAQYKDDLAAAGGDRALAAARRKEAKPKKAAPKKVKKELPPTPSIVQKERERQKADAEKRKNAAAQKLAAAIRGPKPERTPEQEEKRKAWLAQQKKD